MARDATCFPQSIGQAATWDPELVEEGGPAHRRAPARPWAPARPSRRSSTSPATRAGVASRRPTARTPTWRRALGCAYVRGIQSTDDGGRPVIATAKHMVGHGVPEGGLNTAPAHIGPRELHDVFLFPFEAAVREAGIGSVMHAYDELDGVPCAASRELLTTILRERWGFDGIVVADYLGIEHLLTLHEMVADLSDAAVMTLDAGLDMELPATNAYGAPLRQALDEGRVDMAAGRSRRRARPAHEAAAGPLRTTLRAGPGPGGTCPAREAEAALARHGPALHRAAAERRHAPAAADLGTRRGHRPERRRRPQPRRRLRTHRAHRDAAREPGTRRASPAPPCRSTCSWPTSWRPGRPSLRPSAPASALAPRSAMQPAAACLEARTASIEAAVEAARGAERGHPCAG